MANGFNNRLGLLAVTVGGLLMSTQLVTAPPAHGCLAGQVEDPVTRMCWSQSGQGETYGGVDGPCLPGRLGNCVGTLQKSLPGARCTESRGGVRLRTRQRLPLRLLAEPSGLAAMSRAAAMSPAREMVGGCGPWSSDSCRPDRPMA